MKRFVRWGWLGLVAWLMIGCLPSDLLDGDVRPTATLEPTPTLAVPETEVPAAVSDGDWVALRPGLERRLIDLEGVPVDESLYVLRLDPAAFRFDVAYRPGQPQSLAQWQSETGAMLVINGGFFTEAYQATGLIIVDGQPSGVSYTEFGGMLAVTENGPELRWLPQQPYDPAEMLQAGLQSFPMLIKPGGQPGYPEEDGLTARRTVIGQDRAGRILFLIAGRGNFSLNQLGRYLVASDLDLDKALNLDGGASSGLLLVDPADGVPAFSPLPTVIMVYSRS